MERRRRDEEKSRRVAAARDELPSVIAAWAQARNAELFFEDAARRTASLPEVERSSVEARLRRARELLGGTDALERIRARRTPEER